MAAENQQKEKALAVVHELQKAYPNAKCTLDFSNPLELLVATILAAQCTDVRVNQVTAGLFKKYPAATDYAKAHLSEFEQQIKSTGFYRNKAKNIIACCRQLLAKHQGQVPAGMEELTALPGVGRKTANVILGNVFSIPGLVVDTHVRRVSRRLGLTGNSDPTKIEFEMQPLIPQKEWVMFSHRLVEHGRKVCQARKPRCSDCCLAFLCPYFRQDIQNKG